MEHHPFAWVSVIPGLSVLYEHGYEHAATSLLVVAVLILFAYLANRQLVAASDAAVPDDSLTLRNIAELLVEGVLSMAEGVLGPNGRHYVPLYGSFFLFILCANLVGLLPGFSPPTSNFNVTFALGVLSFIAFNYYGFHEQGVGYLQHFVGPIWWLGVLMVPLELIDNFVRPFSLALRLFGNMTGDHVVLEIFTDLTKVVIPVVFYMLGAFVSLVQAFVFTLLSMVYVSLAVAGHGDHH
ncbi:MAG TPA: F0F1 ATP synthase subunit A [Candidatus Binatia bacterium]|nr:F0F1 ATP synthase subunit A [Candidatus Binatia bacterium]